MNFFHDTEDHQSVNLEHVRSIEWYSDRAILFYNSDTFGEDGLEETFELMRPDAEALALLLDFRFNLDDLEPWDGDEPAEVVHDTYTFPLLVMCVLLFILLGLSIYYRSHGG